MKRSFKLASFLVVSMSLSLALQSCGGSTTTTPAADSVTAVPESTAVDTSMNGATSKMTDTTTVEDTSGGKGGQTAPPKKVIK